MVGEGCCNRPISLTKYLGVGDMVQLVNDFLRKRGNVRLAR